MNYTETFSDFARRVGPTDLALYAGAALILYVLFQNKLNPLKVYIINLLSSLNLVKTKGGNNVSSAVVSNSNNFQDLVLSWKQTRDLAVAGGCEEAVSGLDAVFPNLSPGCCKKEVKVS